MSAEPSEQMIELLKELEVLKQMEKKGDAETDAAAREKRRQEIGEQIKQLGEAAS